MVPNPRKRSPATMAINVYSTAPDSGRVAVATGFGVEVGLFAVGGVVGAGVFVAAGLVGVGV